METYAGFYWGGGGKVVPKPNLPSKVQFQGISKYSYDPVIFEMNGDPLIVLNF